MLYVLHNVKRNRQVCNQLYLHVEKWKPLEDLDAPLRERTYVPLSTHNRIEPNIVDSVVKQDCGLIKRNNLIVYSLWQKSLRILIT